MKSQKLEELGRSGRKSAGDESKTTGDLTVVGGVVTSMKTKMVEEKEEDSRIGPGIKVGRVGLEGGGERGILESGSSVGLMGTSMVESIVALGPNIGVQNRGNEEDIELSFNDRAAMEGVEVDESDEAVCATSEVSQIEAQTGILNDSIGRNVKKWKRAARAWFKAQILGKASSTLQRMLVISQKINKSPRRKSLSPGKHLSVSKSRQRSSPNISGGEQDSGNSLNSEIMEVGGKRKGSFVSLEELQEAKKKRGGNISNSIFRSAEPGDQARRKP
ncbi:hypothetical protein ACOSQ4_029050 [Xanthoceras sorbifolium]